jgi:ATP-binding cassette subfamily B protein
LRGTLDFVLIRFSSDSMARLVRDAFARVQRFSSDWHANTFAGATVRRLTRGMWAFDTFTDTMIFNFMPAMVAVAAISAVFLIRWPLLGLLITGEIFVYLGVSIGLSVAWVGPASSVAQRYDSRISANLADCIGVNQVVKSFAAEIREDQRFARLLQGWKARARIAWGRGAATGLAQAGVLIAMQATMPGMGLWLWGQGAASPGDVASLVSTQMLISGYLRDIGQHVRNAQQAIHEMEDIATYSETAPHIGDIPGAATLRVTEGAIHFDKVSFGYAGTGLSLYERFSLEIRPGERVGLVGASGSGKSTFVKLLQRLYDLDGGRILIDGQDIAKVSQVSLRQAIGLVPPENIAYGRPQVPPGAIQKAASLAHADIFIDRLPKTYRRQSASAASSFLAVSGKGWRLPARSLPRPLFLSSMRQPPASTRCRKPSSAMPSRICPPGARRSLLRTDSRRCKASIAFSCLTVAASSRMDATPNSSHGRMASIAVSSRRKWENRRFSFESLERLRL